LCCEKSSEIAKLQGFYVQRCWSIQQNLAKGKYMKKFLNNPENFVHEMLDGIYMAHPKQLGYVADDRHCMVVKPVVKNKVGIATGGGSGHLPLFLGYVGAGLLDGAAVGGVFQSPSADQMLEVTKAIDQGAGVLYIYGNYSGDILNFDMATEMAEMEKIKSPKGQEHKRRGVAGIFFVFKAAGAAAAEGMALDEVQRVAEKAKANTRTMGVALTPCIVPEVGHATFSIGEKEMEIGMGIHGEPGIRRGALLPADAIVEEMMKPILAERALARGDEVAVLVNGLGATPKEELYVLFRKVSAILQAQGVSIFHVYIGEFATSMEMAGASISILYLDDELKRLVAAPASSPFFMQNQL
jgi:phosphoenolpyruvate---glycerone phosphotransferase subunit DhaK